MLLTNFKENCTKHCRRRTCLEVKNLEVCDEVTENNDPSEVISEEKSQEQNKEIRQGCWSNMLKKLTRRRRLSLKDAKPKMDVQRLYPSRTFMIKKPTPE